MPVFFLVLHNYRCESVPTELGSICNDLIFSPYNYYIPTTFINQTYLVELVTQLAFTDEEEDNSNHI